MKLVRLYPRNPDRGWFIQTYVDPQLGLKFVSARGWYEVEDSVAATLESVRQKEYDSRSQPAFAIAKDAEEAREIERSLINPPKKVEEIVGTVDDPVPVKRAMRPGTRASGKPRKKSRKKPTSRKRSMKLVD